MQDAGILTGIVLKVEPIGEYDRRVVILTKEKGKIATFARGARKQGSLLLAATNPFCFGKFRVYAGRNTYSLNGAEISNYFEELRVDLMSAYYGMYFLEVIDYYTRENSDESQMLTLLYLSLRALLHTGFKKEFVKTIFEIKALMINGEYPGIPTGRTYQDGTQYTLDFMYRTSVKKLYTFSVTDEVLRELTEISEIFRKRFIDRPFKSLDILKSMSITYENVTF